MINIKSKILLTFSLLLFYSCMEPNIEDLWSYEINSSFETNGFARDISINNDTVFIAAGQSGVQVWDLNSMSLIKSFFGYYEGGSFLEFEDVALIEYNKINNLLFVTESNKDVMIFNYDSEDSLRYRNTIMSARTKDFISFANGEDEFVMYSADNDDGMKWGIYGLDTTNLFGIEFIEWTPSAGGEIYTPGKPTGIDSDGISRIAMTVDQIGVEVFSLDSLGSEPQLIGRVNTAGNALAVKLVQDGVFVACDNAGAVYIPNESFSSASSKTYPFAQDLTVNSVTVKDRFAVLSIGSKGISVYDISDPTNPIDKGIFPIGYAYNAKFWNDEIIVCTREGLQVLNLKL